MNHVARIIDPEVAHWAQAVRECRRRLGLKQFAFAEMLGTSQSAVSRWEAGAQVPGYAMQNKVRDLLHKPLYDDRADRVVVAQVRHALGHVNLTDASLGIAISSPAVIADHGGRAALDALLALPVLRETWARNVEECSWRAPLFGGEVVSVTGVHARLRLGESGPEVAAYVRYQLMPLRLSTGGFVVRAERVDIPWEEGQALAGARPTVVTLDDL